MNAFGFFLRRLAWQFGIRRERARWSALTRETHLLAEAQDLLGKLAWPATENLEGLSGEYWQMRDLDMQQTEMRKQSDALAAAKEEAENRLYAIEEKFEESIGDIRQRKSTLMDKAVEVLEDVEQIKTRDGETRRRFNSMKAKLEVLKKQGDEYAGEIEKTRDLLASLKAEHSANLAEIAEREAEVQKIEQEVAAIDQEISDRRSALREETASLVAEISRMSKQIAELSAKIGAIDNRKNEISFQIGKYLSNHMNNGDPGARAVMARFRPIAARIRYLQRSIQYNQRLARRAKR